MYRVFCLNEQFNEQENVSLSCNETKVSEYITRLDISLKNNGESAKLIPVLENRIQDKLSFYMIPCVMYNGNGFGSTNFPSGMFFDGEPWVFSADRTGVPGCTYAETKDKGYALFSDTDSVSKNCSCSVYEENGEIIQKLYFAHIEAPKTLTRSCDPFSDPIIEIPIVEQGEEKHYVCYFYEYEKTAGDDCYGYKKLYDFVSGDYCPLPEEKVTVAQTKEWDWVFIDSLIEKVEDGVLSNIGFLGNGTDYFVSSKTEFIWRKYDRFQAGWCGQNFLIAELHLRCFMETGDRKYKEIGIAMLDTWLKRRHENGLISVLYDAKFEDKERLDVCNEGTILSELIACSKLLREMGEDASKYEQAAEDICEVFLKKHPDGVFPQVIYGDGSVCVAKGGAGAFMTVGLLDAYNYFHKKEYLDVAEKSFDFYCETYLNHSLFGGGALDTYCIDKEGACPVLRAAIALYKITGKKEYLDYAEKSAYYLMTWCFFYNVDYPEDCDFGKLGFYTTGGTAVSTSHHHLDCWGANHVADMMDLYLLTGAETYKKQAAILWRFTTQYNSDGTLEIHENVRAPGMQNEAIFHCNYGHSPQRGEKSRKGTFNDWIVAWIKAFQLRTIYLLGEDVSLL